jgi:hypothetical protein
VVHFAHYVRRRVVAVDYANHCDPWFAEDQPDEQGIAVPEFHVTRSNTGPAERVAVGDTIWLFAQLSGPRSWGKFPPSLDARIEVAAVKKREDGRGFRYTAGPGSAWFPISDATKCLTDLRTRSKNAAITSLLKSPKQPVGQALQTMRELENGSAITSFATALSSGPFEFVSYRLLDGTFKAFKRALELVHGGHAVFWDRWSLPRRLAERREDLDVRALDRHLTKSIKVASKIWVIATPLYGAPGKYSKKELRLASKLKKPIEISD